MKQVKKVNSYCRRFYFDRSRGDIQPFCISLSNDTIRRCRDFLSQLNPPSQMDKKILQSLPKRQTNVRCLVLKWTVVLEIPSRMVQVILWLEFWKIDGPCRSFITTLLPMKHPSLSKCSHSSQYICHVEMFVEFKEFCRDVEDGTWT